MSEDQNGREAWFDSEGYFNSQMRERLAAQIGNLIMDNHAADIRAAMAEGKARDAVARADAIGKTAVAAQAELAQLQQTQAPKTARRKGASP
jgi:hypothetical protein